MLYIARDWKIDGLGQRQKNTYSMCMSACGKNYSLFLSIHWKGVGRGGGWTDAQDSSRWGDLKMATFSWSKLLSLAPPPLFTDCCVWVWVDTHPCSYNNTGLYTGIGLLGAGVILTTVNVLLYNNNYKKSETKHSRIIRKTSTLLGLPLATAGLIITTYFALNVTHNANIVM